MAGSGAPGRPYGPPLTFIGRCGATVAAWTAPWAGAFAPCSKAALSACAFPGKDDGRLRLQADVSEAPGRNHDSDADAPAQAAHRHAEPLGDPAARGRLTGELLRLSDPVRTQWQPLLACWCDATGAVVLGGAEFRRALARAPRVGHARGMPACCGALCAHAALVTASGRSSGGVRLAAAGHASMRAAITECCDLSAHPHRPGPPTPPGPGRQGAGGHSRRGGRGRYGPAAGGARAPGAGRHPGLPARRAARWCARGLIGAPPLAHALAHRQTQVYPVSLPEHKCTLMAELWRGQVLGGHAAR